MKPTELTLASLIAIEGTQWHYHIPRFQREYVWWKDNWTKLLEDIYENEPGHYMGSIICVLDSDELAPGSELIYEVVDGQQRLTTLSLLLAAIYRKMGELASTDNTIAQSADYIIRRNGIEKRLIKKVVTNLHPLPWGIFRSGPLTYCLRVQPSTQDNNLADYQYILRKVGILPEADHPNYARLRKLYKAFDYFSTEMPETLPKLNDLLDRISALSFIHISETSQSKAFMLFETLNYRGVSLSAIDIIKNKMLATLESKHGVSIEVSFDEWQKLLNCLPEDRDKDRFLRQFYNAFKINSDIKIEKIPRATNSTVIPIYESLIKKNAPFILAELAEKAKIYNQFLEPEKYRPARLAELLEELDQIGAAPAYTFLLYLFSLPETAFGEPYVKEKTVELLCKFYFRRNVTDVPNTRDLDTINIDLVEQCQQRLDGGAKLSCGFIAQAILGGNKQPAILDEFKKALADNLYANNDTMARFALAKLDETRHTREYAPDLWARNVKGIYVWTVEHVFPQGRKIPSDWVKMIANGDKVEAERLQGEWVHCLGNLTLSGYNSDLSNLSFSKKQAKSVAHVFGNPIHIGYKNGLALNNISFAVNGETVTLATSDKWTVDHIKARNTVMVDMLINLFKFDNE